MGLATEKLGTVYGERTEKVDGERALAYAEATNDDNPLYRNGVVVPPVFGVVPAWDAMWSVLTDVVPPESMLMLVHGEHDMHFHQPLVPGQVVTTAAEPYRIQAGRSGTRFTIRCVTTDQHSGATALEQYATMFIRGMSDGDSAGPEKPAHTFPAAARPHLLARHTVHVDEDQTHRYSRASGDVNAIHLDEEVARSVGLPGVILHGLCTMAMAGQGVLATVADGDATRLKRLAVRFSRPVFPGNDVVTSVYDGGEDGGRLVYAFEVHSNDELVITHGRAEVAP